MPPQYKLWSETTGEIYGTYDTMDIALSWLFTVMINDPVKSTFNQMKWRVDLA